MIDDSGRKNTQEAPPHDELLNAYYDAALRLVPLKPSLKKPLGNEWQRRTITRKEVEDNLERGGGVGIQAGECSGWISAGDLDHPIARRLAPYYLPETLTSGKDGEDPSHHVYISEGLGFRSIVDIDSKHLIDIVASNDGAGHQFVVEPSVHDTKGPYKWTGGFDTSKIARISSEDLDRRLGLLGAATLLAIHYPERGKGRHDFGLCVAGYLLRNGESAEDVRALMTNARKMQPEAPTKKSREGIFYAVESSAKRRKENKKVKGGRTLDGMVPGLSSRLAEALGWERTDTSEGRKSYMRTDDGNALRFVDRHGELLRYCPPWKAWLVWDGQRWLKGAEGAVVRLARETARSIFDDLSSEPDKEERDKIISWATTSQNANRIKAMISLASSDERVEVYPDVFDADHWLLTVENGTLDLRTGELRKHDPRDNITKLTSVPYDPGAAAPRFKKFLSEIFAGEEGVITYVQRFAGYSLTGVTRERCLAILHGGGQNGKSTFIELIRDVIGDYAQSMDAETILAKKYQGVSNDVAALKGARFLSTSEIEEGRRLNESKVKQLTGTDTVTARFLFSEPFDFKPEFKLWISTNSKPEIKGTNNAIWDRICLIPFAVRFEGKDKDEELPEKLREEVAGVLAWLVEGCLAWQKEGLAKPKIVEDATQDYREEMDTIAAFIADRCVVREGLHTSIARLHKQYRDWCEDAGEVPLKQRAFGDNLGERGYRSEKISSGPDKDLMGRKGIGIRTHDDPDDSSGRSSSREEEQSRTNDHDESQEDANTSSNDSVSPLSGRTEEEAPLPKNAGFAGDSSEESGGRGRSGRKIDILPLKTPTRGEDMENSSSSSSIPLRPPSGYTVVVDSAGFENYINELEDA